MRANNPRSSKPPVNKKSSTMSSEDVIKKVSNRKAKKDQLKNLLKTLEENFTPTEKQFQLIDLINEKNITIVRGQAGTGKTITVCYTYLKMLFEGTVDKIIFTKPLKESGENLGFIPGDISDKLAPYVESFLENCQDLIGEENLKFLIEQKLILCKPIAYMRGSTKKNSALFLDEWQNCTPEVLMLYITRFGVGSKMVLAGDVRQTDIKQKRKYIIDFLNRFKNVNGMGMFEFQKEDIMRHPMLIEITDIYDKWQEENEKEKK